MDSLHGWKLRAAWLAALAAATALLCAVAIVNGGPLLYPDTIAYVIDGERLAHLTAPYAVRPIYYGILLWPFDQAGAYRLAVAAQALVVAHLLAVTLRATGARPAPLSFVAIVLAIVLLTPVAWPVAHLLPDIFVAVLILALFLLGFCHEALARWEQAYLFLLATGSATLHLTMVPVGAAVAALAAAAWLAGHRRRVHPVLMLLPLLLAVAGSLAVSDAIFGRLTLTPNSPPAFLARLLADGPARRYLDATCPASGFELCNVRQSLPATEDGFLWGMLPSLPVPVGKRIKAEAGAVVIGTIRTYPMQVAGDMIANAARQLVTFQSETQYAPQELNATARAGVPIARALAGTVQARGGFEEPKLDPINAVHFAIVILCLPAALALSIRLLHRRLWRATALIATVLAGAIADGAVTGAFGGVFARYEARVIWLLPFAVITAALALRNSRRTAARTAEPACAS
ncbi:MAG: hypothetical protein RQ966_14655 [Acetobacteraceae bacterium]|nr:hypothetical protein [Acetobacteraceae bacterium]